MTATPTSPASPTPPSADGPGGPGDPGDPGGSGAPVGPDRPGRTGRLPKLLAGLVLVVLAAALGRAILTPAPAPELAGIARDPALQVHGLTFVDHGSPVTTQEVGLVPPTGELLLLYFGYLSCPDICPMTMADIARAQRDVGPELASRTTVAFVTVDPERDDPERLRGYLSHFFDGATLPLSAADEDALDAAARQLGVRYEIEPHEPGDEDYGVGHTAITYVIDDTGTIVRELPFGVTSDELAQVIRALLP
jgi:protein SCO1